MDRYSPQSRQAFMSDSPSPIASLADRVQDRVTRARQVLGSRDGSPRPRRRPPPVAPSLANLGHKTPMSEEVRALRIVFHELGEAHRQYRRRTGTPVSTELRSAAMAFKQEPSLISLVPVAGFLDDLNLLTW